MKNVLVFGMLLFALSLAGCDSEDIVMNEDTETAKTLVRISTRATDGSFCVGDRIGLYMVNYVNDIPQPIKPSGNYANNKELIYSASGWTATEPIYWNDIQTHADFYAYYPFDANIVDSNAYPFMVNVDQSTEASYTMSDFMWGKTSNQSPTTEQIQLMLRHCMSKVIIKVEAGEGFSQEDLLVGTMSASIHGIKNQATIDLSAGAIKVNGEASTIIPCKTADCTYKAIVIPQNITEGNLISVTLNDACYNLKKQINFESSKQYTFTVTLAKKSGGIDVGIGSWEDDGIDYGGTVE